MLLSLLILTTTRARKTSVLWRAKMSISHARLMETPSRKSSGNMPIRKEGINWVMNWPFLRFLKELIAFISKCLTEVLRKGETLVIYNVTRYDMGYYMCIAKNGVPPARSKSIRVHVSFKPEVHIPNQVIGSPLRTNITLRCDVSAFPKPIMYWSDERGNILVSNTKYIVKEIFHETFKASISMTILNVDKSDYQTYQCVAKNTMGENQELIKLYEIHRPYQETTSPPIATTTVEYEADQDTFTTQLWTQPGYLPEQKQPSPHLSNSSHIIQVALANLRTVLAVFLTRLLIL